MLAIGAASSSECLENCLYFAHCTVLVLFLFPGVPPPPCMSSQGQPGFSDQHFCSLLYYDRWGHFVGRKRADNKLCSNGKGSYCAKDITSVPVSVVFSGLLLAAAAWHFLIQLCLRGFKDPGTQQVLDTRTLFCSSDIAAPAFFCHWQDYMGFLSTLQAINFT